MTLSMRIVRKPTLPVAETVDGQISPLVVLRSRGQVPDGSLQRCRGEPELACHQDVTLSRPWRQACPVRFETRILELSAEFRLAPSVIVQAVMNAHFGNKPNTTSELSVATNTFPFTTSGMLNFAAGAASVSREPDCSLLYNSVARFAAS